LQKLKDLEQDFIEKLHNIVPLKITFENEKCFQDATHCHICNKEFNKTVTLIDNLDSIQIDKKNLDKYSH
jgi:hypothetical protein